VDQRAFVEYRYRACVRCWAVHRSAASVVRPLRARRSSSPSRVIGLAPTVGGATITVAYARRQDWSGWRIEHICVPSRAVARESCWSGSSTWAAHRGGITDCPHQPSCPPADAPDCEAAHVVAARPEQGWSLACKSVVVFEDTGDLLPDGRIIAPHRAGFDLASQVSAVPAAGRRAHPGGSGPHTMRVPGPVHPEQPVPSEDEPANRDPGRHGEHGGLLPAVAVPERVQLHRAWAALHRGQPQ
jgi:hypothetical protein